MRSHSSLFSYRLCSLVTGQFRRLGRRFLLPILSTLLLFCPSLAGVASAGVNTWTTNRPEGRRIQPLAIDPANPATLPAVLLAAPRFSEWSPPVNLGPILNSRFNDAGPALSKDGLSLYFQSGKHELMRSIASKRDVYQPFGLPCGGADIEGIACGATKSRDLTTTDCRDSGYYFDFYSFSGTAGQQVTIRLTSSGFVPGIGLYDPFEQLTAGAYNAQGGTSTLLVFTLNASGTWRIGVSGDTDETGAYTLTLECSAAASCVPDPTALCLNNGRFRVAATFLTPDGRSGNGQTVPETSDTGLFWFFSASNIEAIVKVVNGCAFNDRYWVFAAGLTNVQVVLTVTDTSTGETRTYTNPQGTPFAAIQDTNAFAACP